MNAKLVGFRMVAVAAALAAFCVAGPGFADGVTAGPHVGHTDGPGGASGQGSGGAPPTEKEKPKPKTVLETLAADATVSQFAAALKAAGLDTTLKGAGPFTVFAPSDMAFLDLDAEKRFNLMQDKAKLKTVLAGHIVSSKMMAADVAKAFKIITMGSIVHDVTHADGKPVEIAGAKIVTADVVASNGVVHIIDKLLLPPEKPVVKPGDKPADKPADAPK